MPLKVPDGLDVAISFKFTSTGTNNQYRVFLYVNGYQFGRYYPHISMPSEYPVPPGILNYDGDNVIAIAIWAQLEAGAGVRLGPIVTYSVESSLDVKFDGEYLRPRWRSVRNQYA
jgi:beta-galactosidase